MAPFSTGSISVSNTVIDLGPSPTAPSLLCSNKPSPAGGMSACQKHGAYLSTGRWDHIGMNQRAAIKRMNCKWLAILSPAIQIDSHLIIPPCLRLAFCGCSVLSQGKSYLPPSIFPMRLCHLSCLLNQRINNDKMKKNKCWWCTYFFLVKQQLRVKTYVITSCPKKKKIWKIYSLLSSL